jgi:hypothetical protein
LTLTPIIQIDLDAPRRQGKQHVALVDAQFFEQPLAASPTSLTGQMLLFSP